MCVHSNFDGIIEKKNLLPGEKKEEEEMKVWL